MSQKIQALKTRKTEIENRMQAIVDKAVENKKNDPTEEAEFATLEAEVKDLNTNMTRLENLSKSRKTVDAPVVNEQKNEETALILPGKTKLSNEYFNQFYAGLKNPRILNNLNFEGAGDDSDSATGGVVAPVIYEGQVIPLAPNNLALRQLAFVTPTSNDIKIPVQVTRAAAAKKLQSTSGGSHTFSTTNPTVALKTLSADMYGNYVPCSLEALQDIGFMQAFLQNDISYAVLDAEEVAYTAVLLDSTNGAAHFTSSLTNPEDYLDMTVQPDKYDAGSAWLMPKRKAISLKKAQVAANQFNPFWVTVNGRDYFHGYPVYHSSKLESVGSPAADAVVFGNFNQGMIIGDRNNSAVLVKVDDITDFKSGIINIFGYRRSGSLVRDRAALRSTVVL